jgi:hypothetical protein
MHCQASPEAVWKRLMFFEEVPGRPPWVLRLLLPDPVRSEGEKSGIGAVVQCTYAVGDLVKRITAVDPPFHLGFEVVEQRLGIEGCVLAPRFLSFLPARFGAVMRKRLERGFARHANASNPYAPALLQGATEEALPRAGQIRFALGDAASLLESCAPRSFDAFALSNILDGAEASYRSRLYRAVRRAATDDAVVVLRSFAEPPPELETNHAERDRSMLWGVVDIHSAHAL